MVSFYWGFTNKWSKIYWFNWDLMKWVKSEGRIGFKDVESNNMTLLAKQD